MSWETKYNRSRANGKLIYSISCCRDLWLYDKVMDAPTPQEMVILDPRMLQW